MTTYHQLWESRIAAELSALSGKAFSFRHGSGQWEEGFILKAPDGPVKLVVVAPEKPQKGYPVAKCMRVVLHYPADRHLRPLSLCYGEPKSVDDVAGAVLNLLSEIRQALEPQPAVV